VRPDTARRVANLILVAAGAAKTAPIAAAVEGPLTAMVPASALQLHPHTSVVIDEAAAAGLRLATYYRETFAGKPTWQGL
jgi:glucosamine-6-phosphate deaminase